MVVHPRCVILDSARAPHLASTVLGLAAWQLADDREQKDTCRLVLIQTFVDTVPFQISAYKVTGWRHSALGEHATKGHRLEAVAPDVPSILRTVPRTPAQRSMIPSHALCRR